MTQEFVTLPRDVVERALECLEDNISYDFSGNPYEEGDELMQTAAANLRAALEQPRVKQEQASTNTWSTADGIRCLHCHLPLSSHSEQRYCQRVEDGSQANQPAMTPIAQRKLEDLVASGYTISGYSIYHEQRHQHGFVTGAGLVGWWRPDGVEYPQPQGEQEPVAWIENLGGGTRYNPYHDAARKLPDGVRFDLYTHPQPRQPLTVEQMAAATGAKPGTPTWPVAVALTRTIEAAHNIK